MMKVKFKEKVYEYDHVTMLVNTKDRHRIKTYSSMENVTMKEFISQMLDNYENTSD